MNREERIEIVKSHFELLKDVFTELLRYFRTTFNVIEQTCNLLEEDANAYYLLDEKTALIKKINLVKKEIKNFSDILQRANSTISFPNLKIEKVDVKEVVSDVVKEYQQKFATGGVEIIQKICREECITESDYNVLKECLGEVILNSIESFSASTGNKIVISLSRQDKKILLTIEDNGCGIPKHLIDKVFKLFFTTKYQSGHYGIGLFKVLWFLKIFAAPIEIKSVVGHGTAVTIEFCGEENL